MSTWKGRGHYDAVLANRKRESRQYWERMWELMLLHKLQREQSHAGYVQGNPRNYDAYLHDELWTDPHVWYGR